MVLSKRSLLVVAAVLVLGALAAGVYFLARPHLSEREQILGLILRAERDVNTGKRRDLLRLISDRYHDGVFDKPALSEMTRYLANPQTRVSVSVSRLSEIRLNGDRAAVDLRVRVESGGPERTYEPVTVKLRKEGRQWRVISATGWQAAPGEVGGL